MCACKKHNGKCVNCLSLQIDVSLCKQDAGYHIIRPRFCPNAPVSVCNPAVIWHVAKDKAFSFSRSVPLANQGGHTSGASTKLSVSHNVIFLSVWVSAVSSLRSQSLSTTCVA